MENKEKQYKKQPSKYIPRHKMNIQELEAQNLYITANQFTRLLEQKFDIHRFIEKHH